MAELSGHLQQPVKQLIGNGVVGIDLLGGRALGDQLRAGPLEPGNAQSKLD